jgi:hypothetical protein
MAETMISAGNSPLPSRSGQDANGHIVNAMRFCDLFDALRQFPDFERIPFP